MVAREYQKSSLKIALIKARDPHPYFHYLWRLKGTSTLNNVSISTSLLKYWQGKISIIVNSAKLKSMPSKENASRDSQIN